MKRIIILLLLITGIAKAQTVPTTAAPAHPTLMQTNSVYQDQLTRLYYTYNGSTYLWHQLTDSIQVARMIRGTGGSVTSITPGVGFLSHTPITTSGTMNIDTASTIVSKSFAARYAILGASNTFNKQNTFTSTGSQSDGSVVINPNAGGHAITVSGGFNHYGGYSTFDQVGLPTYNNMSSAQYQFGTDWAGAYTGYAKSFAFTQTSYPYHGIIIVGDTIYNTRGYQFINDNDTTKVRGMISGAGYITGLTGTANQITVTGTTAPVLSIPSTFIAPGTVGIGTGTTASIGALQTVSTSTSNIRGIVGDQYNSNIQSSRLYLRKFRGTFAAPTTVVTGDIVSNIVSSAYDGTNPIDVAQFRTTTTGTVSTGNISAFTELQTSNAGTLATAQTWNSDQTILLPHYTTNGLVTTNSGTGLINTATIGRGIGFSSNTITIDTTKGYTWSGSTQVFSQGLNTNGNTSSNLYSVLGGSSAPGFTNSNLLFGGVSTFNGHVFINGNSSTTVATNGSYFGFQVAAMPTTTATSGTSVWFTESAFNKFGNVTNSGASVTNSAIAYFGLNSQSQFGVIAGGSSYTNGTYTSVSMTGGTGTGSVGTIVVAGGVVSTVLITTPGTGYLKGDVLSAAAANIGGTGSGFTYTLGTNVYGIYNAGNYTQAGVTSGAITFNTQAAAGTYNWNWPTTAGTSGQVILSGGGSTNPITYGFTYRGAGQTTLVAGTKAVSVTGVTTSSQAFVTLVSVGGTITTTAHYAAVCTSGTVTITALTNAGATNTTDTSIINYYVIN